MALVPFPGPHSGNPSHPDDDDDYLSGRLSSSRFAIGAPAPDEDDEPAAEGTMSFLEHLDELRKRIINSCIAIAVGVLVGFAFINRIVDFILGPTRRTLPPGVKMIYTQPGEAFSLYVQVALIAGGAASRTLTTRLVLGPRPVIYVVLNVTREPIVPRSVALVIDSILP